MRVANSTRRTGTAKGFRRFRRCYPAFLTDESRGDCTMTSGREHWESIYQQKGAGGVSWYRPHLERSLRFIDGAGLPKDAAIIDVGGGASTLVDDLLEQIGRAS